MTDQQPEVAELQRQVRALVEAGEYIQPYIRSEMLLGRYPVPIPAIEALEAAIASAKETSDD